MLDLKFKKILLTVLLTLISLIIWCQESVVNPVISSKNLDGRINCIYQDRIGFIWIGKESGLFRYDGYKLEAFRHNEDIKSIGNDNIQCIIEDRPGNLWIGTKGGGLNLYNRKNGNFERFVHSEKDPESIAYSEVFTILPDSGRNLWIGTDGGGLDYYNARTGKFTHYNTNNSGLVSNKVLAIHRDVHQNLWLGTWDGGLHFMDVKTKTITHLKNKTRELYGTRTAGELNVFRIVEKSPGTLYLATWGQGLISYNTSSQLFNVVIPSKTITYIRDLKIANDKVIWAATSSGLIKIAPGQEPEFIAGNTELSNTVTAVTIDFTNIVWVGDENGSVGKINPFRKKFNLLPKQNPLCKATITAMNHTSESDKIYAAFGNKLILMDIRTLKYKVHEIPYPDIVSLLVSNKSTIITSSNGLSSLKNSKVTAIDLHDSIFSNRQMWTIFKETDTSFLLGTLGAAFRMVKTQKGWAKNKTYFTGEKAGITSSHYPACFLTDKRGNLWIGTFGGGLCILKKATGTFTYFKNNPNGASSLSDNFVECLLEDKNGNVWVGTHNGLDCINLQNSTIKNYKGTTGLQNSWIASLEEDSHGNIWAGTHGGLSCIHKNGAIRNYDTEDGLPSNYFTTRVSTNPNNGSLWFGTDKGVIWFYPDSIATNPFLPKVTITNLAINNLASFPDKKVVVKQNTSFSFQFAALQYFNPEKNKYKYILKGYDKEWHLAGQDRTANFSDVPPGRYVFTVVASNDDGIWSPHETSMEITIQRRFPWMAVFFAIPLLILGIYLRKSTKKKAADPLQHEEQQPHNYREVNPSEIKTESTEDAFLRKALNVVEENMGDPDFGVDQMCYKICISRSQLYRKIHAITGLSVTEFIKEVRLKRAAQLLKQKPGNIAGIAYSVGFNDPKYFSKCFKQKFGVSPARYLL